MNNSRQGIDMAQHFLKSAAYRDYTVDKVSNMTEWECFCEFVNIRWGGFDVVACQHCGVIDKHYYRRTRCQWRCKHCDGYFSVTTGTVFENRRLAFKKMLLGIVKFVNAANGISFHNLSGDIGVQVKTAEVFVGKLRESLYGIRQQDKLQGVIHMDGGHFGGRPRHGRVRKNSHAAIKSHVEEKLGAVKKNRAGRSRANWKRFKKRRIVITLRELYPEPGLGACKTIVATCMAESEEYAVSLAKQFIEPGSTVMTDEGPAFSRLSEWFEHQTVQHAIEFSTIDGVSDNQAESYFSRMRRHTFGVSHRIEPKYMTDITTEMAWREDVRRKTQRERVFQLLGAAFSIGRSQWWRGYWQKVNRPGEILWNCASNAPVVQGS